ncbi:hypothetical protein NSX64_25120, partial [Salmonella enterica]|nr:hypothetical protein [Salmonella enterica]
FISCEISRSLICAIISGGGAYSRRLPLRPPLQAISINGQLYRFIFSPSPAFVFGSVSNSISSSSITE